MKKLSLTLILVLQAFLMSAQLRVEVPDVVSLDEQFNVTFIYEGENSPSGFEWSQGDDFQLVWGPQQGRSTSIQIINGKRTKSSQFTYTYILTPRKTGTFQIPAATVTVKGNTYSTRPASITVVSQGASAQTGQEPSSAGQSATDISDDNLFLKLTFSKRDVVVGEPIVATLKLYQRVNIAGFEDARFPSFNGFWNQEIESPSNIEFHRESLNDRIYNTALLRKYILIPQQAGKLVIDPAELVCLVNVRTVSSGSVSIFDEFFDEYRTVRKRVSTPSYTINVSALPSGAPASFKGGVGQFSISASLSKDSLRTHDAASLIVRITGKGNVSLLEEPDVVFPPDFEVYDTKVSESIDKASGGISGSKTYEFPFIPRSAGDFAIAPVKYSYYDINAGKYVTMETDMIPFSVAKGNESDSAGPVVVPGVTRRGVKDLNQDIRFINTKDLKLASKGEFFVGSAMFWIFMVLVAAAAAAMYWILRLFAARRADVVGTKTRGATKMAKKRLHKASEYLSQNVYSAFYEELHKALTGYVADKLNMPVADLSKEKIAEALCGRGVPEETASRFVAIVDACEFARYSPDAGNAAMSAHYQDAVDVISSIDSYMKNRKKTGTAKAVAALLMLSFPLSGHAADAYVDSLFNAANAAYSEGRWGDAVTAYTSVENLGLESPALYCNLGSAYYKEGDIAMAMLYYERALKLDPSYSDARYNRTVVSDFVQDRIEPVPEFILKTWVRELCYGLDSDTWAVAGLVFLVVTAAALLLLFLSSSLALRRTGFFSAIVFLLLAVMAITFSFWQKADYMRKDGAIIMTPVVSVKSSPSSEASTDLFILHEGTKVLIIDEVGEWRNIELADGRQGWMRSSDMSII